jgi:hypothetical protein
MKDELENIWKEEVVWLIELLFRHLSRRIKERN